MFSLILCSCAYFVIRFTFGERRKIAFAYPIWFERENQLTGCGHHWIGVSGEEKNELEKMAFLLQRTNKKQHRAGEAKDAREFRTFSLIVRALHGVRGVRMLSMTLACPRKVNIARATKTCSLKITRGALKPRILLRIDELFDASLMHPRFAKSCENCPWTYFDGEKKRSL